MRSFLAALFSLVALAVHADTLPFYIGSTGSDAQSQGIFRVQLDLESGKLSSPQKVADARRASFLAISSGGEFLYTTAEGDPGRVAAYAIQEDGGLKLLGSSSTGGAGPTHIWIDGAGKNVLVANYTGGSIASLPIKDDGSLGERTAFVQHQGSSINPDRQKEPHAHGIYTDSSDRFVYVPDLGIDKVMIYAFDSEKGSLQAAKPPFASVKPGSGPRHLAFNPAGGYAYLINEMASTINVFKHDAESGSLEELQTLSTLPADFKGSNTTAEIFVHPNGRFVYGSNRGHDSIAVFGLDDESGKLTVIQHIPTGGVMPRNFAIDPTGKWLIASNQKSDDCFVFSIDLKTGRLTATGEKLSLPTPMSIAFMPRD